MKKVAILLLSLFLLPLFVNATNQTLVVEHVLGIYPSVTLRNMPSNATWSEVQKKVSESLNMDPKKVYILGGRVNSHAQLRGEALVFAPKPGEYDHCAWEKWAGRGVVYGIKVPLTSVQTTEQTLLR